MFKKARIYWHAAGFDEDLKTHPERAEHFGLTTLEAMAASCVPFAFAGGGQKDIITDGYNGFLWNSKEILAEKTHELLSNNTLYKKIAKNALKSVKLYSIEKFNEFRGN